MATKDEQVVDILVEAMQVPLATGTKLGPRDLRRAMLDQGVEVSFAACYDWLEGKYPPSIGRVKALGRVILGWAPNMVDVHDRLLRAIERHVDARQEARAAEVSSST